MDVRVSKKSKTETPEDILKELSEKFPDNSYRITSQGNVVRKYGKSWFIVCTHNIRKNLCADEACGGGSSLCIHNIPRTKCLSETCGGGGSFCKHKKLKSRCRDPSCGGGGAYCKHNKLRTYCADSECEGGGSLCKHKKSKSICSDPECEGGGSLCKHKKPRTMCPDKECGGGGALCIHGRKDLCPNKECGGGGSLCKHNKERSRCLDPECEGGGSFCKHLIRRSTCRDPECGGGGSYCIHGKVRSLCLASECEGGGSYCIHKRIRGRCLEPECGGGGSYCKHLKLKRFCTDIECGGGTGICIKCNLHRKQKEDYCVTCHPDYIPSMDRASKIGCKFICHLQSVLGINIKHLHYDKISKTITGSEESIPEYKGKKVDGYYVDSQGQRIVIEFLGDMFHGHLSKWGSDEQNEDLYGRLHKDNFNNTERVFTKVASFGYIIRYVWESDYKKLKALQSPLSILREFKGKLEY